MAERTFDLYYPQDTLIDPMGSVIINVNTTADPQFEWVFVNTINAKGAPDRGRKVDIRLIGYRDTTSYKIKYIEQIKRHNSTSQTIGSTSCLHAPDSSVCGGFGPYSINGKRYYIDFIVLYFVNTSVVPQGGSEADYILSGPILSVDTSRCTPDYGIFIAVPMPKTNLGINDPYADATQANSNYSIFTQLPDYTNDLGKFNLLMKYRATTLQTSSPSSYYNSIVLTPSQIVQLTEKTISNGQTSIVAVSEYTPPATPTPLTLRPQLSSSGPFRPKSYLPILLFRYISEDAPTRRVTLSFSFAPVV